MNILITLFILLTIPFISLQLRRSTFVCKNGERIDGHCVCNAEYVGRHCERKKMCETFRRHPNGTCISCQNGYSGVYCDNIDCVHGQLDKNGLKCICEKPYSGTFCDDLDTKDVYRFYNNRVYLMGPLGALSLIPLCGFLYFCEKMAKKRQLKRVGSQLKVQNMTVHEGALKNLLTEDV